MWFSLIANAANEQLSTYSRSGEEKEQEIRVRCRERGIKFRVIRHNTLLSLYHTALHSSAPSFKKLWEATKPMAQSVCCCEKQLFFWEVQCDGFSSEHCRTLLYLRQPVWHWTRLNLSQATPRYSTCLRASESERAKPWPRVYGWVQIPA